MSYLRLASGVGEAADVWVEIDGSESSSATGEQDAGLRQRVQGRAGAAVAMAQSAFEDAVRRAVSVNTRAFLAAANALEEPPAEMEIIFGLKATGELGNLAVGKIAGESNYQVRMIWRRPDGDHPTPGQDKTA